MNTTRLILKFAFFIAIILLLQFLIPIKWAVGIVWFGAGLLGIERLFRGILQFKKGVDIVDVALIAGGGMFGFVTFFVAEYVGDEESVV
jgi:hypothetical protein